jgi:MoaA/NifB/PqqE/SkfB family radical SAM enzyme
MWGAGKSFWNEVGHVRRREFDFLILFVTGQCNARCHHCFYWEHLGSTHAGLPLDEIEKIAARMPKFRTLLLSGGEPTLRKDLPELVGVFFRHNKIRTVSIPTNGLLPDRIASLAEQVAAIDVGLRVNFNLSIDGFAETHDGIRGVAGNFANSLATIHQLRQVAARKPNLHVLVNTVICADNYEEVVAFARYVQSESLADEHYFEIVRGDPPDERVKDVPPQALYRIYDEVLSIQRHYLLRSAQHLRGLYRAWRQVEDLGGLLYRYRTQWAVHSRADHWPVPCMAGEVIATIDYDGLLRVCELRESGVNLADYGFDFQLARNSPPMCAERAVAKTHICDCTHVCFVNTALRYSLRQRFLMLPWLYLRYRLAGSWQ